MLLYAYMRVKNRYRMGERGDSLGCEYSITIVAHGLHATLLTLSSISRQEIFFSAKGKEGLENPPEYSASVRAQSFGLLADKEGSGVAGGVKCETWVSRAGGTWWGLKEGSEGPLRGVPAEGSGGSEGPPAEGLTGQ